MSHDIVWLIPCPQCGYDLRIPDPRLFGRRARCPKCQNKFVLERPDLGPGTVDEAAIEEAAQTAAGSVSSIIEQATLAARGQDPAPPAVAQRRSKAGRRKNGPAEKQRAALDDARLRPSIAIRTVQASQWLIPDPLRMKTLVTSLAGASLGALLAVQYLQGQFPASAPWCAVGGGILACCTLIRPNRR